MNQSAARKPQIICLLILLGLTAAVGVAYITVIPPWQSPDEPTHFEYARILADGAPFHSPRPDPVLQREIILNLDRHDYWRYVGKNPPRPLPESFESAPFLSSASSQIGKNPPLYYLAASRILRIFPASSLEGELYRLRLLSLVFSLLTVLLVYLVAREVSATAFWFPLASAAFAAFLPQFMVIGTSVSPDPMINLFGAAVIYLVVLCQKYGLNRPRSVLLLLLFAGGLLASYKFLILVPALLGSAFIYLLSRGRRSSSARVGKLLAGCGIAAVLSVLAYCGLIWTFPAIARLFIARLRLFYSTVVDCLLGRTLFPLGYWPWFNNELFKSFWLKYGWLKFELPPGFYLLWKIAAGIALAGIVLFLFRWLLGKSRLDLPGRGSLLTLLIYAAIALGTYYAFWGLKGANTTTQGRHLFLVIPAWSVLFARGWVELFPARWERAVSIGLILGFILLDTVSLIGYIAPTFN